MERQVMDFSQSCTTCGGTGKELSNALRAALDAATEQRKSIGCGAYISPTDLTRIVKAAITEFINVTEQEARESEPIPPPAVRRVWRTYADSPPGPEVIAVRDNERDIWTRDPDDPRIWLWEDERFTWAQLLEDCEPLEDWTHEID
jgi:hypothetical protein